MIGRFSSMRKKQLVLESFMTFEDWYFNTKFKTKKWLSKIIRNKKMINCDSKWTLCLMNTCILECVFCRVKYVINHWELFFIFFYIIYLNFQFDNNRNMLYYWYFWSLECIYWNRFMKIISNMCCVSICLLVFCGCFFFKTPIDWFIN